MGYVVYVLYSPKFHKIYVGYASDLEGRIRSHNELAKRGYTVKFRPWVIAFTEEYGSKREALKREKALKSGQGRAFVWKKIEGLGLISA
jgi:putative endonuclease